ncbi:hypothetical protein QA641_14915 [Bradyrhizobium sp. CB1650]|uniref:hypothetical protein n=1 Tax=Bradyrhizobium sp. CB1650 TaxID=3039153 RepID=UPI0024357E68|nr:hypothetical protein [Bradyrhizobium sp. CB1650]WGD55071.1 hypothetical protein QA641_14915 [Bradyrhizobium sp. CB1650]
MTVETVVPPSKDWCYVEWTPVVAGAFCAAALSVILVSFGVAVGLGVSSTSPTWRDASAALALLSGIYLILQAIISFGLGGYIAGRARAAIGAPESEEVERRDGLHGLASWALSVLLGAVLASLIGASTVNRLATRTPIADTTAAEPLLSYELDKLFRSARRSPNTDMSAERGEARRILMTTSSHSGVSNDDRTHLIQQVAATTGLSPQESERRVDGIIADSKTAIARTRRSSIIVAFSIAAATLLGAVAAWAAACAGGRHRDGGPLPEWMVGFNKLGGGRAANL